MNDLRPIRNEEDYDWALAEIAFYFDKEPALGTPDSDRFLILADLIAAYEARHYAIPDADPVDMILYAMEIKGRTQKDLATLLGSKSRASEILKRKRPLTIRQIYKLHKEWGVPADSLIVPYHTDAAPRAA